MRKKIQRFVIGLVFCLSSPTFAGLNPDEDEEVPKLDTVIVEGSPIGGGGSGGSGGGGGGGSGRSWDAFDPGSEPIDIALGIASKSDVRCNAAVVAQGMSVVTSQSDLWSRQYTAQVVFRSLNLAERRSAVQGGFLRLTYADGGTEDWVMPMPQLSDGGINQPIPGSLRPPTEGAGVPKESKVCTKPV